MSRSFPWRPAQGSGGAAQLAESKADAAQLGGLPTALLNLGCFNCGIHQDMLCRPMHQNNLKRIIAKAVVEQDLHIVNLCEVGGHKQGLDMSNALHKSAQDLVSEVLNRHYEATSVQAYMATWQAEKDPTDDTCVFLRLVGQPEVHELPAAMEPQLVIMVFTIASAKHPDKLGLLISGMMHIRTPTGKKTSVTTKMRMTKMALQILEQKADFLKCGASQPTEPVIVLTGDVNLDKNICDSIVQKDAGELSVHTQWQVMTSNAELSGDVLFVKGACGETFDVTVGKSYDDRGMRNDIHDFFGIALQIPMCTKNQRGQKREHVAVTGCANESASKAQRLVDVAALQDPSLSGSGQSRVPESVSEDTAMIIEYTDDWGVTVGAALTSDAIVFNHHGAVTTMLQLSLLEGPTLKACFPLRIVRRNPLKEEQNSSTSGAFQPAEKRVARNNVSYTKAQFLAFYRPLKRAEEEWAAAPICGRAGAMNALTGRVAPRAEKIVQEMYDWYHARVDDEKLHAVFRHLQITLFKNVTKRPAEDVWQTTDASGASQPAAQGEARLVVSREYVACQVQAVLAWREKWLQDNRLPLDTLIRGDMADRFLCAAKDEFHTSAKQRDLQDKDQKCGGNKKVHKGMHSRWSRHIQKLGGTSQMWTLLSFTGRFDVEFLEDAMVRGQKGPVSMPGERSEQQKEEVREAQMARAMWRRGAMLERLQEENKGKGKETSLNPEQLRILKEYQSGMLRRQANKLTIISGHGRLKNADGSFVDIGGNTRGFVRTVLDGRQTPDIADFEGDMNLIW